MQGAHVEIQELASSIRPILNAESSNPFKFGGVVCDQDHVFGQRVAGDPQVVATDGRAGCSQYVGVVCVVRTNGWQRAIHHRYLPGETFKAA